MDSGCDFGKSNLYSLHFVLAESKYNKYLAISRWYTQSRWITSSFSTDNEINVYLLADLFAWIIIFYYLNEIVTVGLIISWLSVWRMNLFLSNILFG